MVDFYNQLIIVFQSFADKVKLQICFYESDKKGV